LWQDVNQSEELVMKQRILISAGCAMLLALSSAAWAGPGAYLSLSGGVANLDDGDATGPSGNLDIESDVGLTMAAALGLQCSNIRTEVEIGYQKNDINKASLQGTGLSVSSGDTSSIFGLLNAYYDFVNGSSVTPFISVGAGVVNVSLSDLNFVGTSFDKGMDDSAIAAQAGAGLSFAVNDYISLDVKYRYMTALDLEIDDGVELDYSSHNIYGGIRASF
jgi:opacity protein-like surface antigen